MGKTFNELFDEFFKKDDGEVGNSDKINNILSNLTSLTEISDDTEKILDDSLGEPDSIQKLSNGHMVFEKKIWHTEKGDLIKIVVIEEENKTDLINEKSFEKQLKEALDFVFIDSEPINVKSFDEQLEEAIEKEEYEKAAEIRDLIKKRKKNKK